MKSYNDYDVTTKTKYTLFYKGAFCSTLRLD